MEFDHTILDSLNYLANVPTETVPILLGINSFGILESIKKIKFITVDFHKNILAAFGLKKGGKQ